MRFSYLLVISIFGHDRFDGRALYKFGSFCLITDNIRDERNHSASDNMNLRTVNQRVNT